jgi:hypothetical protein
MLGTAGRALRRPRAATPAFGPQLPGERSFHIFYQLVRGASAAEREALHLPPRVTDFRYLAQVRPVAGRPPQHAPRLAG